MASLLDTITIYPLCHNNTFGTIIRYLMMVDATLDLVQIYVVFHQELRSECWPGWNARAPIIRCR